MGSISARMTDHAWQWCVTWPL